MSDKNKKIKYSMSTDEDLKLLKKSIEYVKNLDIFKEESKKESKAKKLKKVA